MSDELLNKLLVQVIEMNQYMQEHLATKVELHEIEDRLTTHIDGFVKLHETLDVEIVSLRNKYDRLEERVNRVETKLGLVANS